MRYLRTRIHHVPILVCPVCGRAEVHYMALQEYEILAEYAHGDGETDVDFDEYADMPPPEELFANCVSNEETDRPRQIVRTQIDMALDLLALCSVSGDEAWAEQLRRRLAVLCKRLVKISNGNSRRRL